MQKDDKSFFFLLKHTNKNRIYIKRVELDRGKLYFTSISIFLAFGFSTFAIGLNGLMANSGLSGSVASTSVVPKAIAQTAPAAEPIDYARPDASGELATNSGGPDNNDQLDDDPELERQLAALSRTSDPAYVPTAWAHLGKINNEFGFRRNPFGGRTYEFHGGMDIDGERGDLVTAPANGTVIHAGYKGGYGNLVEIDHGNGLTTLYGHLSKVNAEVGQPVTRGQLIGYVGSTGRSTGPHLHYELRLNDRPINPRHFLPTEPTDLTQIAR